MEKQTLIPAVSAACLALLAGCAGPTVNLATSEPIKVDIAMRLDVYQHSPAGSASKPAKTETAKAPADVESSRRNRMADVQEFKNSRIVGEGREGLLVIRIDTPGDYGDYVRKTVAAENADRIALMKSEAEKEKIPLADVQKRQGELWQKRSFKDEWIEVAQPDGSWKWIQKE